MVRRIRTRIRIVNRMKMARKDATKKLHLYRRPQAAPMMITKEGEVAQIHHRDIESVLRRA